MTWCTIRLLYVFVNGNYVCNMTGPRSAVGNVSGYKCVPDCKSRGREFDPGPVPYFRGDWSWNNFYGHSPPFRWFIQEGLLSVTSESMCTNYWLTACSSQPRKSVVKWTDRPAMTIAVDMGRKATKTKNKTNVCNMSDAPPPKKKTKQKKNNNNKQTNKQQLHIAVCWASFIFRWSVQVTCNVGSMTVYALCTRSYMK